MTLIGNHVLDLEDIKHVLFDSSYNSYLIITQQNHHITNVIFTDEEYEHLLAELGIEIPSPHTDVVFDNTVGHYVTDPQ